jgi:hypothetical protein
MVAARKLPKTNIIAPSILKKDPFWRLAVYAGRLVIEQRPLLESFFVIYGLGEAGENVLVTSELYCACSRLGVTYSSASQSWLNVWIRSGLVAAR